MTLAPKLPPGRANRRALQYAADIRRLRQAGYPFSAIRLALLDVGLNVSLSTVKREASRRDARAPYSPQAAPAAQRSGQTAALMSDERGAFPDSSLAPAPTAQTTSHRSTAREMAQAFCDGIVTNPLFRRKTR